MGATEPQNIQSRLLIEKLENPQSSLEALKTLENNFPEEQWKDVLPFILEKMTLGSELRKGALKALGQTIVKNRKKFLPALAQAMVEKDLKKLFFHNENVYPFLLILIERMEESQNKQVFQLLMDFLVQNWKVLFQDNAFSFPHPRLRTLWKKIWETRGKEILPFLLFHFSEVDSHFKQHLQKLIQDFPLSTWEKSPSLFSFLEHRLEHGSLQEQDFSLWILTEISAEKEQTLPLLEKALRSKHSSLSQRAMMEMLKKGINPMELFPKLLSPGFPLSIQKYALCVLGSKGERVAFALPAIQNCLFSVDGEIRKYAAWALGKMGSSAASALPLLESKFSTEYVDETKKYMAFAIARIKPLSASRLSLFLKALECASHPFASELFKIFQKLSFASSEMPLIVGILRKALDSSSPVLREGALQILENLSHKTGQLWPAVPGILRALQEENFRFMAEALLQRILLSKPGHDYSPSYLQEETERMEKRLLEWIEIRPEEDSPSEKDLRQFIRKEVLLPSDRKGPSSPGMFPEIHGEPALEAPPLSPPPEFSIPLEEPTLWKEIRSFSPEEKSSSAIILEPQNIFEKTLIHTGLLDSYSMADSRYRKMLLEKMGVEIPFAQVLILWEQATKEQIRQVFVSTATSKISSPLVRYLLEKEMGRNHLAITYKAWDLERFEPVVLRIIHPEIQERSFLDFFVQLGKKVTQFRHPCIASVYEMKQERGVYFYAREYVEGRTLREHLERVTLSEAQAISLLEKLSDALSEAQKLGLVHGNIHPEKIFITSDGSLKLCDFMVPSDISIRGSLTRAGLISGNPEYFSPEQIRADHSLDTRSDIYSLGTIFYEMVTGKKAFEGTSATDILYKNLTQEPIPPSILNPELSQGTTQVIQKMMHKDLRFRYQSPNEAMKDLEKIKRDEPLSPPFVTMAQDMPILQAPPSARKSRGLFPSIPLPSIPLPSFDFFKKKAKEAPAKEEAPKIELKKEEEEKKVAEGRKQIQPPPQPILPADLDISGMVQEGEFLETLGEESIEKKPVGEQLAQALGGLESQILEEPEPSAGAAMPETPAPPPPPLAAPAPPPRQAAPAPAPTPTPMPKQVPPPEKAVPAPDMPSTGEALPPQKPKPTARPITPAPGALPLGGAAPSKPVPPAPAAPAPGGPPSPPKTALPPSPPKSVSMPAPKPAAGAPMAHADFGKMAEEKEAKEDKKEKEVGDRKKKAKKKEAPKDSREEKKRLSKMDEALPLMDELAGKELPPLPAEEAPPQERARRMADKAPAPLPMEEMDLLADLGESEMGISEAVDEISVADISATKPPATEFALPAMEPEPKKAPEEEFQAKDRLDLGEEKALPLIEKISLEQDQAQVFDDVISRAIVEKQREMVREDKDEEVEKGKKKRIARKIPPKPRLIRRFEKILGEDAGRPGPVERFIGQSVFLMKSVQATIGMKFILMANAVDVVLDSVAGYVRKIYNAWRFTKGVKRRIDRRIPETMVKNLRENLKISRLELSRFFALAGFSLEEWHSLEDSEKWKKLFSTSFALHRALEMRKHLDEMKEDLSLLTVQQVKDLVKSSVKDFLTSFIPNPMDFITGFKDFLIFLFWIDYSRKEIEEMYGDFLVAYGNMIDHVIRNHFPTEEKDPFWERELMEHEGELLARTAPNANLSGENLDQWIHHSRTHLQRLFFVLIHPEPFMNPAKWKKWDLVLEMKKFKKREKATPSVVVEMESWLRKEVNKALKEKGFKIKMEENFRRMQEERDLRRKYKLQKKLRFWYL